MSRSSELPGQLSGVGATALGVARLRAVDHARPDRLVNDPYAERILAAAAAAGSPWAAVSPQAGLDFFALMADQVAVRTRFLDHTLLRAARAGCSQVVLLACGMDTRAYRLDWPSATRVFEVDFGEVLAFRDAALASHGVTPRCHHVGWPLTCGKTGRLCCTQRASARFTTSAKSLPSTTGPRQSNSSVAYPTPAAPGSQPRP
ncbi:MAG: SAM-dependent methyltransferase [Pseudonocardiaceae bacterium]